MKYSGVEWIGEIPDSWNIRKVKQCFYISKEQAHEENPTILSLARTGVKVRDISNNEGQLAASYDNYNPVQPGDLLLNPMDLYSGANCSLSEVSGVISPAYVNLRKHVELNPKFFDYYFKTQYWAMAMFAHGKGVSFDNRWTMNAEAVLNYYLPFPTYEEQNRIVETINKKVKEIDSLIEIENQQIDKLKDYKRAVITEAVTRGLDKDAPLKDSGVEWIGNIPEKWRVSKVSYFYDVVLGKMLQPNKIDENDTLENYLCAANVGGNKLKIDDMKKMWFSEKEKAQYGLKKGDLLVVEGGDVASSAFYDLENENIYIQNALHRVRAKSGNLKYLRYYLMFIKYSGYFEVSCNKATIAHFTKEKFCSLPFLVAPSDEIEKIVLFLDKKFAEIDALISVKQKKIDVLYEYKKSFIYEYISGKKEVC